MTRNGFEVENAKETKLFSEAVTLTGILFCDNYSLFGKKKHYF